MYSRFSADCSWSLSRSDFRIAPILSVVCIVACSNKSTAIEPTTERYLEHVSRAVADAAKRAGVPIEPSATVAASRSDGGVARRIRAGQVFVNEWYAGGVETPFGGYGKSGYGREKGREALWNYVQTKNIAIGLGT